MFIIHYNNISEYYKPFELDASFKSMNISFYSFFMVIIVKKMNILRFIFFFSMNKI